MPLALVCSSEAAVADSLRVLLGGEWTIFVERTPGSLLRAAEEVPADAVFIDEFLPDAHLVDVVHALRRRHATATIVALALSSRSPRVEAALPAGLDEVLTKPFDRDQVALLAHRVEKRLAQTAVASPPPPAAPVIAPAVIQPGPAGGSGGLVPTLRAILRATTDLRTPTDVAQRLLDALCEVLALNRGAVLWADASGRHQLLALQGLRRDRLEAIAFRDDTGLPAWLRTHNRMCIANQPGETLPSQVAQEMLLLQAAVAVPLVTEGRLHGVLALGNKVTGGPFSPVELELLLCLAQFAGALLGNAAAQIALADERRTFQGIVKHLASGIVMIDAQGCVQVVNDAAARVLNVAPQRVLGQPAHRLGSLVGDLLLRTLSGEEALNRYRVINPATSEPIGANTAQLRDETGAVRGAVMVCTSLAGVPAAEREPEGGLDTWNKFALAMAHAIKNPLVAIKTFTQLFPDRYEDKEFREAFFPVAAREVERLDRLVETLMQYGDEGGGHREECELHALLMDAVAESATASGEESSTIEVDTSDEEPITVLADRDQLREAISHLILNAREAAGVGGGVFARVFREENGHSRAVIEVEDTGPGLDPDATERATSPFYTTKDKGLGLGLALTERVARLHGGKVRIGRSDRGGAKVSLVVPLPAPQEDEA